MLKKITAIFLPLLFLIILPAQAALQVSAEIDAPTISIDEDVTITVSVSGNLNASDPVIPKVAGLDIVKTGRTSQIQIVNGKMSITAQFLYTVIPAEEGDFTIPPFIVYSGGTEVRSNSLKLKVSKNQYGTPPQTLPPSGQDPYSQQTPQPADQDPRFWISTTVSNKEPYLSEQLLYRFKLYTRENITQAAPSLPKFDNFWSETVVADERGNETINGVNYATWEKVIALVPLKDGPLTIEPAQLDIVYEVYNRPTRPLNRWDPFFNNSFFNNAFAQTKKASLKSKGLEINVKPLPTPYPKNFTGLVGEFGLQSQLSDTHISADETVTLELHFSGSGNIQDAVLPELKFDDFKTYFDKPTLDTHYSEKGVTGKKSFKIALVPTKDGDLTLPALTLSYFDPTTEEYVALEVDAAQIKVDPAKEEKTNTVIMQPQNGAAGQEVDYQDIAPIITDASKALGHSALNVHPLLFGVFVIGLPGLFFVILVVQKLRKGFGRDRRKILLKNNFEQLNKILSQSKVQDHEILDAIRDYMTAAFHVEGQALTAPEIKALCEKHKLPGQMASTLGRVVERLESAHYGFDKEHVVGEVIKELKPILENMHRVISGIRLKR